MRKLFYTLPVLASCLILAGCSLRDEFPARNGELILDFEYTLNMENTDQFADEVNMMTVYVFDEEGFYLDTYTASGAAFSQSGRMNIPLPEGRYTVLTAGGPMDTYHAGTSDDNDDVTVGLTKGVSHIDYFRMMLKKSDATAYGNPVAMPPSPLFYGRADFDIPANGTASRTISLVKDTSVIIFRITKTASRSRADDDSNEVYCGGRNTYLDALNGVTDESPAMTYLPKSNTRPGDNQYEITIPMGRLIIGMPVNALAKDRNSDEKYIDNDLVALICATGVYETQEDLDREDTFVIDIVIEGDGADVTVTVSINGWELVDISPVI